MKYQPSMILYALGMLLSVGAHIMMMMDVRRGKSVQSNRLMILVMVALAGNLLVMLGYRQSMVEMYCADNMRKYYGQFKNFGHNVGGGSVIANPKFDEALSQGVGWV